MDSTTRENVIYFKDLIFAALHRWKAMVAVALILGVALGGYQAASGLSRMHDDNQIAAEQLSYEQALAEYQNSRALQEKVVAKLEENLKNQQEYVDKSLFMALDPYCYYEARIILYVDTDYEILPGMTYQNPDMTPHILTAYRTMLHAPRTQMHLAETARVEYKYFGELFFAEVQPNTNQMSITIMHPEQTGAEALLERLQTILLSAKDEISQSVYPHDVVFFENNASAMAASTLADDQEKSLARLDTLQTELTEAQAALAAIAAPAAPATATLTNVMKKAILFFAVGCVLGVALVTAWAWVAQVFSQKVFSAKALSARTGIKILGTVASAKRNPIDRVLRRLEGRQVEDPEARLPVLVRDVANRCGGGQQLLVAGDSNPEHQKVLAEALQNANITAVCCGSILHCAEAVDALAKADAVLLVEQCGCSRYTDVAVQCQKISDYGKQLLGCILIDG